MIVHEVGCPSSPLDHGNVTEVGNLPITSRTVQTWFDIINLRVFSKIGKPQQARIRSSQGLQKSRSPAVDIAPSDPQLILRQQSQKFLVQRFRSAGQLESIPEFFVLKNGSHSSALMTIRFIVSLNSPNDEANCVAAPCSISSAYALTLSAKSLADSAQVRREESIDIHVGCYTSRDFIKDEKKIIYFTVEPLSK